MTPNSVFTPTTSLEEDQRKSTHLLQMYVIISMNFDYHWKNLWYDLESLLFYEKGEVFYRYSVSSEYQGWKWIQRKNATSFKIFVYSCHSLIKKIDTHPHTQHWRNTRTHRYVKACFTHQARKRRHVHQMAEGSRERKRKARKCGHSHTYKRSEHYQCW